MHLTIVNNEIWCYDSFIKEDLWHHHSEGLRFNASGVAKVFTLFRIERRRRSIARGCASTLIVSLLRKLKKFVSSADANLRLGEHRTTTTVHMNAPGVGGRLKLKRSARIVAPRFSASEQNRILFVAHGIAALRGFIQGCIQEGRSTGRREERQCLSAMVGLVKGAANCLLAVIFTCITLSTRKMAAQKIWKI